MISRACFTQPDQHTYFYGNIMTSVRCLNFTTTSKQWKKLGMWRMRVWFPQYTNPSTEGKIQTKAINCYNSKFPLYIVCCRNRNKTCNLPHRKIWFTDRAFPVGEKSYRSYFPALENTVNKIWYQCQKMKKYLTCQNCFSPNRNGWDYLINAYVVLIGMNSRGILLLVPHTQVHQLWKVLQNLLGTWAP